LFIISVVSRETTGINNRRNDLG